MSQDKKCLPDDSPNKVYSTSGSGCPTMIQSSLTRFPSNTDTSFRGSWMAGLIGSISLASSESDVSVGSRPFTETLQELVASPAIFFAETT